MQCPRCSEEAAAGSRYCGSCGGELLEQDTRTRTRAASAESEGGDRAGGAQFVPGVVLGKRYRVVNLLGRGGMGEVYRADDLKLGLSVALKFLPPGHERDRSQLDRLLDEVRLARSISHANVCRVYDIGEVDGRHFISMELVDGEDLASLLRRIGRLSHDKALQIARQLCAGLAAAHGEGILHRDLKPANVMLDGRGRARIMDFGLAVLEESVAGGAGVGTPAYMAPEQRSGGEVTVRSDLYALGLVLHELFTGKRALDPEAPPDPPSSSSSGEGLDPEVERVIASCLEREPARRPASAHAVAAALPGGDALAAALMAGETPPPDVVAAAGGEGSLRPALAVGCLVAALGLLAATPFLHQRASVLGLAPLPHPPEVLAQKARDVVERLGYVDEPVDEAHLFFTDWAYLEHVRETDPSASRWDGLAARRPTPVGFWYRSSPRHLNPWTLSNHVWFEDPPVLTPGMINVELESSGELRSLWVVPAAEADAFESAGDPDWPLLFELAGLDPGAFTAVAPELTPRVFCDARAAWEGGYSGQGKGELRLEACAYRGRPVEFRTLHPWSDPRGALRSDPGSWINRVIFYTLFLALILGAAIMARRNLRMDRGDRRGAFRVGAFVVVTSMVGWTLTFDHVPSLGQELVNVFLSVSFALFLGNASWLFYVAMEPPVRRLWPQLLISWSRVLAGRWRDPLVGTHLLLGALLGLVAQAVIASHAFTARWLGHAPERPADLVVETLHSPGWFLGDAIRGMGQDILMPTLLTLFQLIFLYYALRRRGLAAMGLVLVTILFDLVSAEGRLLLLPFILLAAGLHALIFVRLGLVGALAASVMSNLRLFFPVTADSSAWYFGYSLTTLVAAASLIIYSFWLSLAGQSVFGDPRVPERPA